MILRKAKSTEINQIWEIIQYAIAQRKADGSTQWQDGYPNENTIQADIEQGYGYIIEEKGTVLLYAAVIFGTEPAYENIVGKWLSNQDYVVIHRVAASPLAKGKSIATKFFQMVEGLCLEKKVYSIKVDTNFDNMAMLRILEKLAYTYCGEVYFRGAARKAFEKVLPR
ncbi:GNAT family N-acetyltransferase [Pedobacter nanyangensis]|uniref:GNAT family N-acetyltransferase n=1 Tax=Pedobacter nanyangensis TaxID=1562389 RepID=UPI000DE4EC26|nr:GNAT family N-acetyltransferase [Pedobacter nanyangensis]